MANPRGGGLIIEGVAKTRTGNRSVSTRLSTYHVHQPASARSRKPERSSIYRVFPETLQSVAARVAGSIPVGATTLVILSVGAKRRSRRTASQKCGVFSLFAIAHGTAVAPTLQRPPRRRRHDERIKSRGSVGTQGIVDVLEQTGVKRPDTSVFSGEFLAELAGIEQRNLAREMLERLLRDEIKFRSRQNAVQARKFSEMLAEAINKYQNRSLTTMQLIEHLIEFVKELRDEPKRAEEMGLAKDELAFYDALARSKSAMEVLGDIKSRAIARDLVKNVRESATID